MSSSEIKILKPVLSVSIVILTLFGVVFLQMEERRLGYSLLKVTRDYRRVLETKKNKEIQLAKVSRPQFVQKMASARFTLKKAEADQIILMNNPVEEIAE
jgi:hypothetical protein